MPRPKRSVRASGVARSLGAGPGAVIRCLCCGRWLPRDAIAHIGRKSFDPAKYGSKRKKMPRAFCGKCWQTGAVWRDPWVVELEIEAEVSDVKRQPAGSSPAKESEQT